jgi:hypothetical protein
MIGESTDDFIYYCLNSEQFISEQLLVSYKYLTDILLLITIN